MSGYYSSFLQKIPGFCDNERHSIRIVGRKCTGYAEIRGESAGTFRSRPEHREGSARVPTGRDATKGPGSPRCARKQRGLVMNWDNLAKTYVDETKIVGSFCAAGWEKTRGENMKVSSTMLLKTNGGKMSLSRLSTRLLKKPGLCSSLHDVYEKKGIY